MMNSDEKRIIKRECLFELNSATTTVPKYPQAMRFRVSPDDNRVLPEQNPTAHYLPSVNANHLAPIDPAKSEISTLTKPAIPYQVGDRKAQSVLPFIPANPETAVVSTRPAIPYQVADGKAQSVLPFIPVNPETAVVSTRPAIPYQVADGKAQSVLPLIPATPETAVTSTNSLGYRAGVGKGKSVIPKKRKLVKTMMYHCIKDFLKTLFRRSPKTHRRRPKPIIHD